MPNNTPPKESLEIDPHLQAIIESDIREARRARGMRADAETVEDEQARARIEVTHQMIGTLDAEALEKNRKIYGAKGANLLALQTFLDKFCTSPLEKSTFLDIQIPPFHLIPATLYIAWRNGEDITAQLRPYYDHMASHRTLMVRSSAVESEDGANTTGAGVYESVLLRTDHAFEDFCKAVYKIYTSCESDTARRYRAENGIIAEEKMGIVIQQAIYAFHHEEYAKHHKEPLPDSLTQDERDYHGHFNSTRPYTDEFTDIHYNGIKFPLIFKKGAPANIHTIPHLHEGIMSVFGHTRFNQVEFETFQWERDLEIGEADLLLLATLMERHYGCPVQVEFILKKDQDESGEIQYDSTSKIYLVQIRPLPQKMFTHKEITFPDDLTLIAEFEAAGVCDEVLPVLTIVQSAGSTMPNNEDKKGIVIIHDSWEASYNHGLSQVMPRKGVVIVNQWTQAGRGHVETIALEKGLTLLIPAGDRLSQEFKGRYYIKNRHSVITKEEIQTELPKDRQYLRVVANGTKARIYAVSEGYVEPPPLLPDLP